MKKFLVKLLVVTGIGGLLIVGSVPLPTNSQGNGNTCQSAQDFKNCAQGFTVKVLIEKLWGSGVLIQRKPTGNGYIYTVATNAHVLTQVRPPYKIKTADGQTYNAQLLAKSDNLDIALLQFQTPQNYPVASLNPAFTLASLRQEDTVFAAGYPVDASQGFQIKSGKVAALLPQPMSDGYLIGFSADIVQGMSGGALLNRQGEVVGIIGRSSYPANGYPSAYSFDHNFPTTLFPKELMETSSWAIPIEIVVAQKYSELGQILTWNLPMGSQQPTSISRQPTSVSQKPPVESQQPTSIFQRPPSDVVNIPTISIDNSSSEISPEHSLDVRVENDQRGNYDVVINQVGQREPQRERISVGQSQVINSNVQNIDLNGDNLSDIIVNFSIQDKYICPGQVKSYIFLSESSGQKYQPLSQPLELRDGYSVTDLDGDGTLEIKSYQLPCKLTGKYETDIQQKSLPLQIWKIKNNQIIDVTGLPPYRQAHEDHAKELYDFYYQNKDYLFKNKEELRALLAAYLVSKAFANQQQEGWQYIEQWYPFEDRDKYFQFIKEMLRLAGLNISPTPNINNNVLPN